MNNETEYFSHICKSCFTPCKDVLLGFKIGRLFRFFISFSAPCHKCNKAAIIPIDTPKGQELIKRIGYIETK
jgi:hypothetical protein